MTNYFLEYQETLYTMYKNSGKEYNDFGRYSACVNLTGEFRYVVLMVPDALPYPMSLGLCVPWQCTAQDLA